jgi:predicted nucleic acid-binding protein
MNATVDTNILVYVVDARDPLKQRIAIEVFAALALAVAPIALQVIGEFQNAVVRRLKRPPAVAAAAAHQLLATFRTFGYDATSVERATSAFATGRFSYWDGLLLASVERAGLDILLSENMTDGNRFSSVTIINPFSPSGMTAKARAALNIPVEDNDD